MRWASNHHPNKGPQDGRQLHGVAVTHRVALYHFARAGHLVEKRTEKVEPERPTKTAAHPREAPRDSEVGEAEPSVKTKSSSTTADTIGGDTERA